jgi:hypothetical protein
VFAATLALVLASVEAGYRLGRWRVRSGEDAKDPSAGSMVGATLGLLAFMLAFTFSMAAQRFDTRRQLVRDEAAAVEIAYLRSGFLAEPRRSEVRALLREYADVRLAAVQQGDARRAIARSEEIHRRLWSNALAEGEKKPGSIVLGLFAQALGDLIDVHTQRVQVGLRGRIPSVIIHVLFFVTVLAMTSIGCLAGLAGKRTHLVTWALILSFSSVMFLIVDLDRPQEGLLTVSQQAMLDVRSRLSVSSPREDEGQGQQFR